jgi:hypothetical protein
MDELSRMDGQFALPEQRRLNLIGMMGPKIGTAFKSLPGAFSRYRIELLHLPSPQTLVNFQVLRHRRHRSVGRCRSRTTTRLSFRLNVRLVVAI